jgi:hypothetical protein
MAESDHELLGGDLDDIEPDMKEGEEEGNDEESDGSAAAVGGRRLGGRVQKTISKKGAKRGKYNKAVNGKKLCGCCNKMLPLEKFPAGSSQCLPDRQAIQNLKNASKSQGQDAWWAEVIADPKKLRAVLGNYFTRCPQKEGKKRAVFPIAQWVEEVRQSESVIRDGVYEMMHVKAFAHFISKPQNGSMEPEEARILWRQNYDAAQAIADSLGPTDKLANRVAVKTKDLVIIRDQQSRSRAVLVSERDIKKARTEDIEKMESRLQNSSDWKFRPSGLAISSRELARNMTKAFSLSVAAGDGSAFSASAQGAVAVGVVRDLEDDDGGDDSYKESKANGAPKADMGEGGDDATAGANRKDACDELAFWQPELC